MTIRRRAKFTTGEDALADIEVIKIRGESGKMLRFRIADELSVSDDPDEMYEQALSAHTRYAFWSYQASRAMRRLREAESKHARLFGEVLMRWSKYLREEVDRYASTETIRGMAEGDKAIIDSNETLQSLREHWMILQAVADSLDHRAHLMRRLLARDHDATTKG